MIIRPFTALAYFDVTKDVLITCDASGDGISVALMQDGAPIHYASRALTDTETNYAVIEKELLAVVFACKKFRQYIYGKPVVVETDHKPLIAILKKSLNDAPTRLQKLLIRLHGYEVELVQKKGKDMYVADTLSRAYQPMLTSTADEQDEYEVLSVMPVS